MTSPTPIHPADPKLIAEYHDWDRAYRREQALSDAGRLKTTADLHALQTARRRRQECLDALGFAPLPPNVSTLIATATAQFALVRKTIEALQAGEHINVSLMTAQFEGGASTLREAYAQMTSDWTIERIAAQAAPATEAA